jgi:hypothetical protein
LIGFSHHLGGTFFAGLSVFIVLNWVMMSLAARIIIMLGTGISCFVLALLASNDEQFDKIQTPLYLIGVVLQPAGILLAIEFFSGGNWRHASLVAAGL